MRSRKTVALWAAAIGYAVAIFVLSSFPVLGPAQETLALVGDKALHAAEYAGFASLLALAIATTPSATIRSWTALIALLGAVVYAASDVRAYGAGIRSLRHKIAETALRCGWAGSSSINKKNPVDKNDEETVPTKKDVQEILNALPAEEIVKRL